MLEEYYHLEMQVFLDNDNLSRKIIHRLQSGQNIDSYLITEYRFLEEFFDNWQAFFHFLGYRLERFSRGETFYFLTPCSSRVRMSTLRRGASFLGLFLSTHFLSAGIEGKDELPVLDLISRLENSFDFNQLIKIFNPQQGRAVRKRQQSSRQAARLRSWILTNLRQLHRLRFIELTPSVNADLPKMIIVRLPGLARFLEAARKSLDLDYEGGAPLHEVIDSIWTRINWEEEQEEDET
ncbi:MAG: condensin complex protein MksE [Desulfonatronovibrionaceae bacterium]